MSIFYISSTKPLYFKIKKYHDNFADMCIRTRERRIFLTIFLTSKSTIFYSKEIILD